MSFDTEQEQFWAGNFGDDYITRNQSMEIVAANTAMFSRVLERTCNITSIIEFGANVGLNLIALKALLPNAALSGVEINDSAAKKLGHLGFVNIFHKSILEFVPAETYDLVLSKTVLIHIAPDRLDDVYKSMYSSARRYICLAEYYNPAPVEVNYRGHVGKLFKRDFAGEMLARFPDLKLVDYGFRYRNDPVFPMDDITWFLLEKRAS
jgi:pseudaminic acid biosynthesis-associated methylase